MLRKLGMKKTWRASSIHRPPRAVEQPVSQARNGSQRLYKGHHDPGGESTRARIRAKGGGKLPKDEATQVGHAKQMVSQAPPGPD